MKSVDDILSKNRQSVEQKFQKFFFAHRVQNSLKRRQNEFGRKKNFFRKIVSFDDKNAMKKFPKSKIFFRASSSELKNRILEIGKNF